jgi:palmitoyl-protein thioesterase
MAGGPKYLALALLLSAPATAQKANCPVLDSSLVGTMPALERLIDLCHNDPETLADELMKSPIAAVAKELNVESRQQLKASDNGNWPIVTAHGMGDSCFNRGMESVTEEAGAEMGVYSVCIPTGDTRLSDTINGFFLDMDSSVDVFAEKVRADPNLANGFNAFGLSQGNNLIRGYIAKYNDPPVYTFMSICGINAGVGAFPNCSPQSPTIGSACEALTEVLSTFAYTQAAQNILFQADYFRDPSKTNTTAYKSLSQLAAWENEGDFVNTTFNDNFAITEQYVWVLGTEDTVVWPREGEWWGTMDPNDPWNTILPMNQTRWYIEDSFGLRTADEAGKNNWESFDGQHIDFTTEELMYWLDTYFGTPVN